MSEAQRLSNFIGSIYDAALDANLWPGVMKDICAFTPGSMSNIFYQDTSSHTVTLFHSFGADPVYEQSYFEKYAPLNPLFPAASFLEVGTIHSMYDLIPEEEFRETRLYREWIKPQGILDAVYTNLERTATGSAGLAVRRVEKDGLFDADARMRLQLLIPHVRRSLSIGRIIDFHKAGRSTLSESLDHLTAAVILAAQDGKIVFANKPAMAMIERGDILRAPFNQLGSADPQSDLEIQDAIAAASRGDAALGIKGIAISLATNTSIPYVAHVMSLTSGNRSDPTNSNATAAVFIRQRSVFSPSVLELVANQFKLTVSETRVLSAVLETGNMDDIAERLGIGKATVKTHLNRLLAKTGSRRQSDLVRLVALRE